MTDYDKLHEAEATVARWARAREAGDMGGDHLFRGLDAFQQWLDARSDARGEPHRNPADTEWWLGAEDYAPVLRREFDGMQALYELQQLVAE